MKKSAKLAEYRRKRDFTRTAEPRGAAPESSGAGDGTHDGRDRGGTEASHPEGGPRMTRLLLLVAVLAVACGRDDSSRESGMADSTLFGDDRARQGDSARTLPDVALLEHLVDEYEQLDVVMDELAGPTSGSPVKGKAWKGDRHEDADKDRLLDLLQAEFGERYHPRTPEGAARRTDGIAALPHDAGTRALNGLVLEHHQRVYQQIGEALPRLRNPRVRKEITELRQRLGKEIEQLKVRPLP